MMKLCKFDRDARTIGARSRLLKDFLPIETAWFKTVFSAEKGEKLTLRIFAASRYCLYVNGEMVHNGPLKGDRNASFADRIPIGDYLIDGENVVSVKVTAYPPYEAYVFGDGETNVGPFGVASTASGPCLMIVSEGKTDLSTGYADWRVWNDASVSYQKGPMGFIMGGNERIDVSKMSAHTKDADMSDFEPAVVRWVQRHGVATSVPPFALYERTLPEMRLDPEQGFNRIMNAAEEGCEKIALDRPMTLAPNGRYSVDYDAGELRTAYFFLRMAGGAGAKIEIRYCEGYSNVCREGAYPHPVKGRRDDCEHFSFIGLSDWLYPDGREWAFQSFWFRTFRFVRLVIETKDGPLTILPPTYRTTRYPLDVKAKIAPEQSWVRELWDISVRTLELCMHETHEDCPYYEQLQYTFDTRLQMLFTYALSADTRMAERVIYDFHSSLLPEGLLLSRYPTTELQVIPVFCLHWIGMLNDYYLQTGDDRLLRRYRTTVESILDWFARKKGPSGLCEHLGYWEFFDWPEEWGPGYGQPNAAIQEGISTDENLVYALFLRIAAEMFDRLGRTQDAGFYRQERSELLKNIQNLCWNPERKLYREGPTTEEYSQHAQFYAVLNDLVVGDEAVDLMRRTIRDKSLVQATFPLQFDLFRAMEKVGLYEETEQLWPLWQSLLGDNLSTVPEVPGNQTRSDCHAWGAELLFEYPNRILGVYPDKPGYERIGIHPHGLFLGQAAGEVPTPKGMVSVRWTHRDGHFSMTADWPAGVPARITLPDGRVIDSDVGKCVIG